MTEHNNPIEQVNPAPAAYEPAPTYAPAAYEPAPVAYEPAPAPTYAAPAAPTYAAPAAPTYAAPAAPTYAAPAAPTYAAPAAPTYAYPAAPATPAYPATPVTATAPAADGKTKAQGFVGLGLSIGGLVFAIIGLIYCLSLMGWDGVTAFGASIGYGIFSFPCSIVGKILASKSREAGNTSGACGAGSKLGVAGLVVSIVMMGFGFIALLAS